MLTGQTIRERRKAAGMSQARLAYVADVAEATIRRAETGRHKPTRRVLVAIENALKSPVSDDHAPEATTPSTVRGSIGDSNQPAATSKASTPPRADREGV